MLRKSRPFMIIWIVLQFLLPPANEFAWFIVKNVILALGAWQKTMWMIESIGGYIIKIDKLR